jgi:hypothetical protein
MPNQAAIEADPPCLILKEGLRIGELDREIHVVDYRGKARLKLPEERTRAAPGPWCVDRPKQPPRNRCVE